MDAIPQPLHTSNCTRKTGGTKSFKS